MAFDLIKGVEMIIQDVSDDNYIYQEQQLDAPVRIEASPMQGAPSVSNRQGAKCVVACAEVVDLIAKVILFKLSFDRMPPSNRQLDFALIFFAKLLFPGNYTKGKIEELENYCSKNFEKKVEHLSQFCHSKQAGWLIGQIFYRTIVTTCFALPILAPAPVNQRALLFIQGCITSYFFVQPISSILDYAEGQLHAFVYRKFGDKV